MVLNNDNLQNNSHLERPYSLPGTVLYISHTSGHLQSELMIRSHKWRDGDSTNLNASSKVTQIPKFDPVSKAIFSCFALIAAHAPLEMFGISHFYSSHIKQCCVLSGRGIERWKPHSLFSCWSLVLWPPNSFLRAQTSPSDGWGNWGLGVWEAYSLVVQESWSALGGTRHTSRLL